MLSLVSDLLTHVIINYFQLFMTSFDRVCHDGLIYKIKSFGGFSEGCVLGSLFFLMYVNDLSCRLSSTTKRFADDTSLFSVIHDVSNLSNELNDDLEKISSWAYHGKMSFNPVNLNKPRRLYFLVKPR